VAGVRSHPTLLLSAYLDGELSEKELARLVEHLESCAECVREFHEVKEARAALRTLPLLELPGSLVPPVHPGDRLSAYLDGELDTAETAVVTDHLRDCGDCRSELHELDAARTAIRSLPGLDVPERPPAAGPASSTSRRRAATLVAVGAVAAAALAFALLTPDRVAPLDLDQLATRHHARVSVEPGVSVLPASLEGTGADEP
jgi:anti-sigma factor RsiW